MFRSMQLQRVNRGLSLYVLQFQYNSPLILQRHDRQIENVSSYIKAYIVVVCTISMLTVSFRTHSTRVLIAIYTKQLPKLLI